MSIIDPRNLLDSEPVDFGEIEEGDFISYGWKRPRRVEVAEHQDGERVLFLAEPDESRRDPESRCRRLTASDAANRGTAQRFPFLRTLWAAAHAS